MSIIISKSAMAIRNVFPNSKLSIQPSTISTDLLANDATANILTIRISISSLLTAATDNISTTTTTNNLSDTRTQMTSGNPRLRVIQNWRLAMVFIQPAVKIPTVEFRNWKQPLTNILPATVMENESLVAIFPFKIEEPTETLLFSGAALEEKPITVMYTDAKIDGQSIKLILDNRSANSIITRQLMNQLSHQVDQATSAKIITADGATKTPIGEIDNLSIEINGITVPIKLSQNRQHTCVPVTCGHFKPITTPSALLIKFEEEKEKSIWKAYQISWADEDHNELSLILSWDDKEKGKENKKLT
ncbi:hypothetical protein G9A89_005849 [Geosiphon pyriformis]|nr:hypothetical protein G9A89_005849 [Geosiphon pyriformis]